MWVKGEGEGREELKIARIYEIMCMRMEIEREREREREREKERGEGKRETERKREKERERERENLTTYPRGVLSSGLQVLPLGFK